MKRILATVLAVMMLTGLAVVLTGCGGSNLDSELVGYWAWDANPSVYYAFYADGTGRRDGEGAAVGEGWANQFRWETPREGRFDLFFLNARESFTYTIEGDVLSIVNRETDEQSFSYNRVDQAPIPAPTAPAGEADGIEIPTNNPIINMSGAESNDDNPGLVVEREEVIGQ